MLASPLNGQFYVIGNPSDVLGTSGQVSPLKLNNTQNWTNDLLQRTIAPRTTAGFSLDSGPGGGKEDRQGSRWDRLNIFTNSSTL